MNMQGITEPVEAVRVFFSGEAEGECFRTRRVPVYRWVVAVVLPMIVFGELYLLQGIVPGFWPMYISATGLMLYPWAPRHVFQCTRVFRSKRCDGRVRLTMIGLKCTKCGGLIIVA